MLNILRTEAMRASDRACIEAGTSGRELMMRAGKAIFEDASWRAPVAVVCGSGNNAGDGYVIASLLKDRDIPCRLFLLEDRFSEDGRYYYGICLEKGVPSEPCTEHTSFEGYGTVVDCIYGTGFHGEVPPFTAEIIRKINRSGAFVISVDINSGLNGNSGKCGDCVISDITYSVADFQPGHFLASAKDVMKSKKSLDIGIPPLDRHISLLEKEDIGKALWKRKNNSHKGTYGYTALIGGSVRYQGAIQLAEIANCAMRAGAGVVIAAAPSCICGNIAQRILESTLYPLDDNGDGIVFSESQFEDLCSRVTTIAVGMGIGSSTETARAVEYLIRHFTGILIIDADGLNALAGIGCGILKERPGKTVLTPHPKEFSRLTGKTVGEILDDPAATAEGFAAEYGVTVLLKGTATVITDGKKTYLTDTGCPGMATAGSGDVLSGVAAAVCGYNRDDPAFAAAAAAYITGYAGELAEKRSCSVSMTASDTASCIMQAVTELCEK